MNEHQSVEHPTRGLLALLVVCIVTSILHYADNVLFFDQYPEPTWFNPSLVDFLWFVMTPIGIAGYICWKQERRSLALGLLYLYVAMGQLTLGHYVYAPIWDLTWKMNSLILLESLTALIFGAYVGWLQVRTAPTLPPTHSK
ncbi:hypothetical protein [Acaryochloris marina]|uniref:Uncharacterized protein n=1 Tax=Acaryochloris marina (strain MBIC 11017) TaxID=329726 RepID=B0C081_ACAM1|nr:hypothetical protein [Acaryochloris marina]ABW29573.1 hypothetical protein AM1_4599 [Acaryochloris marina MBIC11017]BDM78478.1 hypothetical protein AM10699_13470 [Acaryochloris marina MBIC10699]